MFKIKLLSNKATFPSRSLKDSAGLDLSSAVDVIVPARGKAMVNTDLQIKIPKGTYARIASRSGLAWKNSIDVGAGVVDRGYSGKIMVILFNHSDQDFEIKVGNRIAQLILEKIDMTEPLPWDETDDEEKTERGEKGFGSSGI